MANVSWNFYRLRRRIDTLALVSTGRVSDYLTYLSYCSEVRVIPASQQDFDLEFGPALLDNRSSQVESSTQVPPEVPTVIPVREDGLEATVWLAGIEGDASKSPLSIPPPPKSVKKKKTKEDSQE